MFSLGNNIKKLRKERGLTIRSLAQKVKISHNSLAKYEKNIVYPSLKNTIKLCKFFNVSFDYMMLGENAKFASKDIEFLELFNQVDGLDDEYKILIKNFIKKVLVHKKEKDNIIKDSKQHS